MSREEVFARHKIQPSPRFYASARAHGAETELDIRERASQVVDWLERELAGADFWDALGKWAIRFVIKLLRKS